MLTPPPPGFRLGAITPQAAVQAFEARGLLQPTFNWQDVYGAEHRRAFAVAGVTRLDILGEFQRALLDAQQKGVNPIDFRRHMQAYLQSKGFWGDVPIKDPATGRERTTRFNQARLQLIYDVNMRQSYAAGQWQAIERTKKQFPFIVYRTMRDERVRASHRGWDSVALPVDHPFWRTHFPPNGWRCRCVAFAVAQKDLDRMRAAGLPVKTDPPEVQWKDYVNPHTGEVRRVPVGIDPGFEHNARTGRDAGLMTSTLAKAAQAEPTVAARVVREAIDSHPGLLQAKAAEFAPWAREAVDGKRNTGDVRAIGALHVAAVSALQRMNRPVQSALVVASDNRVRHAVRDAKAPERKAAMEAVESLPEIIARPDAVLVERERGGVLYIRVLREQPGSVAKVVVTLGYELKFRRSLVQGNALDTVTIMNAQALKDTLQYELVWGALP
jgi:SPP1 gp7 family putative phage head morphogenesis protein